MLAVPGSKAGQRFELEQEQLKAGPHPWRFMTVFDIETDDLRHTFDTPDQPRQYPVDAHVPSIAEHRIAYAYKAVTPKVQARPHGQQPK